jgi:hypothetical protein
MEVIFCSAPPLTGFCLFFREHRGGRGGGPMGFHRGGRGGAVRGGMNHQGHQGQQVCKLMMQEL